MILKADISKTSTGRYLFLFIFMCGNSKCTRIQKIKNFSGEVNWVHQALINSVSCLYLPTFRSQAAIVSEKSTLFTFPIEKPKLQNLTLP